VVPASFDSGKGPEGNYCKREIKFASQENVNNLNYRGNYEVPRTDNASGNLEKVV
jgi:hypothetical protein